MRAPFFSPVCGVVSAEPGIPGFASVSTNAVALNSEFDASCDGFLSQHTLLALAASLCWVFESYLYWNCSYQLSNSPNYQVTGEAMRQEELSSGCVCWGRLVRPRTAVTGGVSSLAEAGFSAACLEAGWLEHLTPDKASLLVEVKLPCRVPGPSLSPGLAISPCLCFFQV